VVHRLLFEPKYAPNIDVIAAHLSEQERKSFKAEMGLLKLKKLRYLKALSEKDQEISFPATVTKIRSSGIFFDLDQIGFEGFLHVSNLGDDYYEYDEKQKLFTGKHSHETFTLGTKISVQVIAIDLIFQECSWRLL
jgi:ribonuclease R